MSQTKTRAEFLSDLRTHNGEICRLVRAEFMTLDRAERSAQPEPGEWCVDQCFEHLVLSFEALAPSAVKALHQRAAAKQPARFRPSWLARRNVYRQIYDPGKSFKTGAKVTPSEHYYPDVFVRFLRQKQTMDTLLIDAADADLQRRCWLLKVAPVNLGDYLEYMVLHDRLHIDQAQRAMAAYRQNLTVTADLWPSRQ